MVVLVVRVTFYFAKYVLRKKTFILTFETLFLLLFSKGQFVYGYCWNDADVLWPENRAMIKGYQYSTVAFGILFLYSKYLCINLFLELLLCSRKFIEKL